MLRPILTRSTLWLACLLASDLSQVGRAQPLGAAVDPTQLTYLCTETLPDSQGEKVTRTATKEYAKMCTDCSCRMI